MLKQNYLDLDLSDDASVALLRQSYLMRAIKASDFPEIEKILLHLIKKRPDILQAQIDLVDHSIAHGHMDKAAAYYQNIQIDAAQHNDDIPDLIYTSLIRISLRLKNDPQAADFARLFIPSFAKDGKMALFAMRAFDRVDDRDNFVIAANAVARLCTDNNDYLAEMSYALNNRSLSCKVIKLLKGTSPEQRGHFDLFFQYGRALAAVLPMAKHSIETLEQLHEFGGKQHKSALLLAKTYLKNSMNKQALAVLHEILQDCDFADQTQSFKAQYADVLMACNRHKEAAEVYSELVAANPAHGGWRRACVSALLLSGDTDTAKNLYRDDVKNRNLSNYSCFDEALDDLSNKLHLAKIPPHRFDWAYEKLEQLGQVPARRDIWEDQCRWVNLADHLTLNWLEARTIDADEILPIIEGAEEARALLAHHTSGRMGAFIATAHVGGLFAGPFALARSGLNYRWVASTPVVSDVPGAEFLLSTFSQNKLRLAKKIFSAVKSGAVVSVAIDGTSGAASKSVPFMKDTIRLSDFVPRAIFQTGAKSFFPEVFWVDGRVQIKLVQLVPPMPTDTLDDFVAVWFADFSNKLRGVFKKAPDNLRLTGGLWNDVSQ